MRFLGRLKPVIRWKPRFRPIAAFSLRRGKPQVTVSVARVKPVTQTKPRAGPWWGRWFGR